MFLQFQSRSQALLGFGTPEGALLQTCKELIDNSVTACILSESENAEVILSISHSEINESVLEVSIIDNGCGIADRRSIVQFFNSEVRSRSNKLQNFRSKGKYGVGLTTCLLYSQLHTGFPIRYL